MLEVYITNMNIGHLWVLGLLGVSFLICLSVFSKVFKCVMFYEKKQ